MIIFFLGRLWGVSNSHFRIFLRNPKSWKRKEKHGFRPLPENILPARLQKLVGQFFLIFCTEILPEFWQEFCWIFLGRREKTPTPKTRVSIWTLLRTPRPPVCSLHVVHEWHFFDTLAFLKRTDTLSTIA